MESEADKQVEETGIQKVDDAEMTVPVAETIELEPTKGHMLDVGPGVIAGELPCGFIDAEGVRHYEYVAKEMTGHEEDILAGTGPVMPRLNQIITNCLQSFGKLVDRRDIAKAVAQLTAIDRIVILMSIRRASLGDFWSTKIVCPKCEKQDNFTVNLAKMDIRPMKDPLTRRFESVLSSGKRIEWHIMSADDEEWLTKKVKAKEDVLTLGLMARVDKVDDESLNRDKDYKGALRILKGLPLRERREIRKETQQHEGSVDTTVEFECKFCGHEWKAEMNVGQADFFFPSE
jgi:hypothetical protein